VEWGKGEGNQADELLSTEKKKGEKRIEEEEEEKTREN